MHEQDVNDCDWPLLYFTSSLYTDKMNILYNELYTPGRGKARIIGVIRLPNNI